MSGSTQAHPHLNDKLAKSLGQSPSNKQIKYTVDKFIELFKAVKETPRNSIQGLWCELFLIEQSSFPEKLIAGWHSIPEEKFDFSFNKLRLEVKSSTSESRIHHFSSRQLNTINDTEIINKAYGELQNTGKVRFKDFVNTFAPKEEDLDEAVKRDFNIIGLNIPDVEYSVKEIAEMRGVNPDTDVGLAEVGFAQSLARNDANEVLASKKVLSDYFGQEIPLRYGPETEELEFLNPKTGDYELLNKPGIDAGDMAKFGSTAAVIVPEIVATIFATGATGPTGGVITSAATSAALETARLALGHQLYGINQTEKGFIDYLKNEGKDMAVLNGALTTAGFTVPKLYRMIKQFRNMGKINASDFGGTIKNAEQAQELITKINDRLVTLGTKKKLKFTLVKQGMTLNF